MKTEELPFDGLGFVEEKSGGSERKFYRVRKDGYFFILMESSWKEIERYKRLNDILLREGINVPRIYEVKGNYILMEDLGEKSLLKLVKEYGFNPELYKRVIDALVKFQNTTIPGLPVFGRKKLYNEYEQFKEFYLLPNRINVKIWERYVEQAVEACLGTENVTMHRDFQATNIYFKNGEVYFIDFQDMHTGPVYFDLASLLFDPYVMMQNSYKQELYEYYGRVSGRSLSMTQYLSCAMLRVMQAVSAYIRLSAQGKEFFKGFIKRGKCTLRNILRDMGLDILADSVE